MSRRTAIRYTYQDYLAIPEGSSGRHEIVDGELIVTAAPRFRHQEVVTNLAAILREVVLRLELGKVVVGPVTVRLREDLVLEPDVIFVSADRLGLVDATGAVQGPPDLVVEVLSPSNRAYDRQLKRKRYLQGGVGELWIVDADERSVEVWRGGDESAELHRGDLRRTAGGHDLAIDLDAVFGAD